MQKTNFTGLLLHKSASGWGTQQVTFKGLLGYTHIDKCDYVSELLIWVKLILGKSSQSLKTYATLQTVSVVILRP